LDYQRVGLDKSSSSSGSFPITVMDGVPVDQCFIAMPGSFFVHTAFILVPDNY